MAPHDGRNGIVAVLPRAEHARVTHARLVADWRKTLDAFDEALAHEDRYFAPAELTALARHSAADRRWLEHFSAIRSFP